jgi:hypothetical protein
MVLAVVMRFLANVSARMGARFDAANRRLERFSRWSQAKQMGVPLGADLAGDEWEEPTLLPEATPPPIPPAAFFQGRPAQPDEDWAAVIEAAKHAAPVVDDEWEAAMLAAKKAATPAPSMTEAEKPAEKEAVPAAKAEPVEKQVQPVAQAEKPAPLKPVQKQVQPVARAEKPAPRQPALRSPQTTLLGVGAAIGARLPAKATQPAVDPSMAAATRKTIASALRMPSA